MEPHLCLQVRRAALDWLAPAAIVVIGIVNLSTHAPSPAYPGPPWRHVVFLVTAATALGVRRRAPLVAPVAAIAIATGWTLLWPIGTQGPFEGFVILVGASYCLGINRDRRKLLAGAGVIILWFALGLFVDLVGGRSGDVAPLMVWLTIAFVVGLVVSRRTIEAYEAKASVQTMAAEQARRTEQAIEDERARIARELHDVVAHGLSVIVVQASAERRALRESRGRLDADSADAVLGSIEKAGRDALVDLRRLLGLLRRADAPLPLSPQPGLAQLEDLVAAARDAGLAVELEVREGTSPLPPGLDLTAYRIVQEAVTNVLKHASHAHTLWISVAIQRGQLDVQIRDDGTADGRTEVSVEGSGHGLLGMRERVKVFGGTIQTGTQQAGGWRVHARLPLPTSAA